MKHDDNGKPGLTTVIGRMGSALSRQARERWQGVRTADRNEGGRHVWRFSTADNSERYLHISKQAMNDGDDPVGRLLGQLKKERWLDRMEDGPERAFILSPAGRLRGFPRA